MKQFVAALSVILTAAFGAIAIAAPTAHVVMAGQEQWTDAGPGMQMAVLYGNPNAAGQYIVRFKTGKNWKYPAHTHPQRENITVLSGTFYAGMGSTWDNAKLKAFPAGSFASLPANVPHFAMTKEPAVIEITGMGPMKDVMVKKSTTGMTPKK